MVYQVVYLSDAAEIMPKSKLYKILLQSRTNNKRHDITGALIFIENKFVQIIEGPNSSVIELLKVIESDVRHKNINVLMERNSDRRFFPEWQMAYAHPSAKELAAWAGLKSTASLNDILSSIQCDSNVAEYVFSNIDRAYFRSETQENT